MGWPKFVVSIRPVESTRTFSSGALAGFTPAAATEPAFAERVFFSERVLLVTSESAAAAVAPGFARRVPSPNSAGLLRLKGKASAN